MTMDPKTKRALLYSALVCPGMGHWMLGRRVWGGVLVVVMVGLVVWFAWRLFTIMVSFYDEIMDAFVSSGELFPDLGRVNEMHASIYLENWWLIVAIMLVWAFGVWDIYPRKGARP
jgi:hypothetical protein